MLDEPRTNVGPNVADADDFTIGISDDGTKRIIRHDPSGETMAFGPDGFEVLSTTTGELLVNELNETVWVDPSMSAADINGAITNDLPDDGGMVAFQGGDYSFSEPIDQSKPYLHFNGFGDVTLSIDTSAQTNVISNVSGTDHEWFKLENIEVAGNRTSDGSNEDPNTSQAGVRCHHTKVVIVDSCHIHDTVDGGLNAGGDYTDFLFIDKSRFERAGHLNHATTDAHVIAASGTQWYVTDSYFNYTTDNALFLNNCNGATVKGNHFHDCFINAFDAGMHNIRYIDNSITGIPPRGNAHFYFATGGASNVTIRDNDWFDIDPFSGSDFNAIRSLDGISTLENITIEGNSFDLGGNINNAVSWLAPTIGLKVLDNTITDPSGQGWRVEGGDVEDAKIRGNTVHYTSVTEGDANTNATSVIGVSDLKMSENHINDERTTPSTTGYGGSPSGRVRANTGTGLSGAVGGDDSGLYWERDANSPVEFSGEDSYTYTIDGNYDEIQIRFSGLSGDTSDGGFWALQFNGDAGSNYRYSNLRDGRVTTASYLALGFCGNVNSDDGGGVIRAPVSWDTGICTMGPTSFGTITSDRHMLGGRYTGTSPLNSITIFHDSPAAIANGRMEIYGRTFSG